VRKRRGLAGNAGSSEGKKVEVIEKNELSLGTSLEDLNKS